ncbi:Flagellar M-ring protein FliF [Candidatus Rhodobacter oscarellae]|uniref:Flagellar M-ring protein n=1 Tax=Candidatus Rhodobacter oscarellae TaxID=1675527 RepID=A0A0J9E8F3_9RHOB|nr:flagellar basal-body MS-ring/collar protein FliF [Candidatus Rhodobacter lobularis]KMW59025.1 Flagellar M-ring protein FliF [Candidatus Rhodobacter lobularis]
MQQILSVWSTLDARRRVTVLVATVAMFAAVLGLSRMASQPTMSLLYAGLDPTAAGEVVAALDQQGVNYDVRAGAIFVDAAQRDALRLTLAAEGLPAGNGQGYELLDSLSGFGTTSQMFDAAYWRAKEGELARTITASPQIKGARVHISNPSSNPFQRDLKPTASVTVTTASGGLSAAHAKAMKFLVSSAVAGLAPEDVAVIDGRGGLVMAGEDSPLSGGGADERSAELKQNIERLLEARVGHGNAVVEVAVETVTEREAIFERRFDPENRVAISSDTEERTTSASGSQGGSVTVASNLPDGDAGGNSNNSQSENSETRERVNYEVSETTREVVRSPGAIKKLSVAVLVDGIRTVDEALGESTWAPRSDEELETLRELVASVVGFDADRGDSITLRSLEFEPLISEVPESAPSLLQTLHIDAMSIIQLTVLALVALALGMFVVRPILSRPLDAAPALALPAAAAPIAATAAEPATAQSADGPELGGDTGLPDISLGALNGEIDDGPGPLPGAALVSGDGLLGAGGLPEIDIAGGNMSGDPVDRLRQLIDERKDETIEVLRSWMEDSEETA